jgi:hypothetical protein
MKITDTATLSPGAPVPVTGQKHATTAHDRLALPDGRKFSFVARVAF